MRDVGVPVGEACWLIVRRVLFIMHMRRQERKPNSGCRTKKRSGPGTTRAATKRRRRCAWCHRRDDQPAEQDSRCN